jgi:hypothetical protein
LERENLDILLGDIFIYSTLLISPYCSNDIANTPSLALPAVLAHSGAIEIPAMIMSIFGGLLIYGTIISFSMFFQEQEEF